MNPVDDTSLGRWCQEARLVIRTILRATRWDHRFIAAPALWASARADIDSRYANGEVLPYYKSMFICDASNNTPEVIDRGSRNSYLMVQPSLSLHFFKLTSTVDVHGAVVDGWEHVRVI